MAAIDQENLQAIVAELKALEDYFNDLSEREALLARAIVETRGSSESLKVLSSEGGRDILFTVGAGIFVKTQTPPLDRLVVSVGAGIALEKSKEQTSAFLEERISELEKVMVTMQQEKAALASRINSARAFLSRMMRAQK